MRQSNYEIMRDQMQTEFLKYDQMHMIRKFHLEYDEQYLYLMFVERKYRINRNSGKVDGSVDEFIHATAADYNEAMSIFDVLCYSKDNCRLSGRYNIISNLKGAVKSANSGGNIYIHYEKFFDHKLDLMSRACEQLGGVKIGKGDVSYLLDTFDFLPMIIQFWESDEEFSASLQILWDENIMDYVHFETSFFIVFHVLGRILELVKKIEKEN
jgi:hypothetical protein